MAVLIDPPAWPAHGRHWSHLASDAGYGELHAFAGELGVPERAFEGDHYDVPQERYAAAVALGALPVPSRELLRRLQAAGLRRSKRRGEKVLASWPLEPAGLRRDAVWSALPPPVQPEAVALLVLLGERVVVGDERPAQLPGAPVAGPDDAAVAARCLTGVLADGTRPGAAVVFDGLRRCGHLRTVPATGRPTGYVSVWCWQDAAGATRRVRAGWSVVHRGEPSLLGHHWAPLLWELGRRSPR